MIFDFANSEKMEKVLKTHENGNANVHGVAQMMGTSLRTQTTVQAHKPTMGFQDMKDELQNILERKMTAVDHHTHEKIETLRQAAAKEDEKTFTDTLFDLLETAKKVGYNQSSERRYIGYYPESK